MKQVKFLLFASFTMPKILVSCLCMILFVLLPTTISAQSQTTNQGITWLFVNQNLSGTWGSPDMSEFRDTTVVCNILKKMEETGTEYWNAIGFIQTFSYENNDYLARQINILAREGFDMSQAVNRLVSSQNPKQSFLVNAPEGGWGAAPGYATNTLDTVLALDALFAYGYDPVNLSSPLDYLMASQNQDGGWGIAVGCESNVYLTSRVLMTLVRYAAHFYLATHLTNGIGWLKTQQKENGSFGNANGSTHETAYAYIAIANTDPSSHEAQIALVYIFQNQEKNGSWDDKPYDTAVSLQAILTYLNGTDTDGDHMADWWEMEHFQSLVQDGNGDADKDKLPDIIEFQSVTDPRDADSDDDGLNDGLEVNTLGTDPTLADSDENGTPDGDEDNDGDGLTNAKDKCPDTPEGTDIDFMGCRLKKGDLNKDSNVDLEDTHLGLKVITSQEPMVAPSADVDDDGKIGLKDTIYTIQHVEEKSEE